MRIGSALLAAVVLLAGCATAAPSVFPSASASPPDRTLHVLAVGVDGPVAGLRICARALSDGERCAVTGPDGAIALPLAPGAYLVRSDSPGGQRQAGEPAAAELFSGDARVTLRFERVRTIGGEIRDEASRPVSGARVCANPTSLAAAVCGQSGGDGRYALALAPGTYKLHVDGPPGRRLIPQWARGRLNSEEADVIDVRSGDDRGVDIVLVAGVGLSGVVSAPDGHAVKHAQVCTKTLVAPLPWDCDRTDDRGRYLLVRAPASYWVWVIPPDDEPLVAQWFAGVATGVEATPLELGADDTLDVTLRAGNAIRGTVTGPDGPVQDALVCVDTPFPSGRICRPTDATGAYRVTTRPETYTVQAIPPPGTDLVGAFWGGGRTWLDARRIALSASRDAIVDVVLDRGVRLSGVVRSSGGVPLEGAAVNLSDADGVAGAAYTDETGAYTVVVPPGRYRLDVFAPFASQLVSAVGREVEIARPTTLDVALADAVP